MTETPSERFTRMVQYIVPAEQVYCITADRNDPEAEVIGARIAFDEGMPLTVDQVVALDAELRRNYPGARMSILPKVARACDCPDECEAHQVAYLAVHVLMTRK